MNTTRRVKLDRFAHQWTPRFVILPSAIIILVFVYGFILYSSYLSFTSSRFVIRPVYDWVGIANFVKLFTLPHWQIALANLGIFGGGYILITTASGLFLAILINQYVVGENILRPIYLYPMAISFIVTGTAWKWFLDPSIGLQAIMQQAGWMEFTFGWIKDNNLAIYCVIIAAVWQATGFVMTIFLAGLRAINPSIIEAARVDGTSNFLLYTKIIIPQLSAAFLSVFVILGHLAIKSYDLVIALTGGGPGQATELPSTFVYSYIFFRNTVNVGSSAAVIMIIAISIFIIPYIIKELREDH